MNNKRRLGIVKISLYQSPSDEFIKELLYYLEAPDCILLGEGMILVESPKFDEIGLNDPIPNYLVPIIGSVNFLKSHSYSPLTYINFD